MRARTDRRPVARLLGALALGAATAIAPAAANADNLGAGGVAIDSSGRIVTAGTIANNGASSTLIGAALAQMSRTGRSISASARRAE